MNETMSAILFFLIIGAAVLGISAFFLYRCYVNIVKLLEEIKKE